MVLRPDPRLAPYVLRPGVDLGPGNVSPTANQLGDDTLGRLAGSDHPDIAIAASQALTQTRMNAGFNATPFVITPPFAVHPANPVAFKIQILPQNPKRKSLVYVENATAARTAGTIVQTGFSFLSGPPNQTTAQITELTAILQASFMAIGGTVIAADSPAPSNPVTIYAQYGGAAVVGTPVAPLVGVVFEAA